jgi:hypothetical protein
MGARIPPSTSWPPAPIPANTIPRIRGAPAPNPPTANPRRVPARARTESADRDAGDVSARARAESTDREPLHVSASTGAKPADRNAGDVAAAADAEPADLEAADVTTRARAESADGNPPDVPAASRTESANRKASDVAAAPNAEAAEHDAVDVAAGADAKAADSNAGELLRHADSKHPDAGALDSAGARRRQPQRQALDDTARRFVGRPHSDIHALDAFEVSIPEVDPNSADEARVSDAQAGVVDRQVQALSGRRGGKSDNGNQQTTRGKWHTSAGPVEEELFDQSLRSCRNPVSIPATNDNKKTRRENAGVFKP